MPLVECVPNVSEGRRASVIEHLGAAFDRDGAVALLHVHPDVDHNRTVFTAVGEPEALLDAVADLYARSLEAIDLRAHEGVHPRVGAVDVCPFVPLPAHGSDMEQCVSLARRLGERVAATHELPVILYREAASSIERRDLTAIRRGQFEGLAEKLARPEWKPDFGPDRPHERGGATVIGARGHLIAYNVVLDVDDVDAARQIAATVRVSSGGFPGIKAMGVRLKSRDLVQVSMNVEDPDTTPLHVAVDRVRAEAQLRGISVRETELVGLAPLDSIAAAAGAWLQIADFDAGRVLEEAITRVFFERRG